MRLHLTFVGDPLAQARMPVFAQRIIMERFGRVAKSESNASTLESEYRSEISLPKERADLTTERPTDAALPRNLIKCRQSIQRAAVMENEHYRS
jgi:hypothetical protein